MYQLSFKPNNKTPTQLYPKPVSSGNLFNSCPQHQYKQKQNTPCNNQFESHQQRAKSSNKTVSNRYDPTAPKDYQESLTDWKGKQSAN